ncbi:RNA-directed DNA polymerase [Patescibacteria group bacterium]
MFANIYMDAFDHFIKEELGVKYYLRYTDDFVMIHNDRDYLEGLILSIQTWLQSNRHLQLHPRKVEICKLSQGIDFLGYVTLPHYRVLRTKTKKRMFKKVNDENVFSYLGLLKYCSGHRMSTELIHKIDRNT